MGAPITPTCASFCVGSPEGSPPFFHGEDFSGFFPEFFPGAITTAAAITTVITTAITPATFITITTAATVIGGILIRVKVFPFGETF